MLIWSRWTQAKKKQPHKLWNTFDGLKKETVRAEKVNRWFRLWGNQLVSLVHDLRFDLELRGPAWWSLRYLLPLTSISPYFLGILSFIYLRFSKWFNLSARSLNPFHSRRPCLSKMTITRRWRSDNGVHNICRVRQQFRANLID